MEIKIVIQCTFDHFVVIIFFTKSITVPYCLEKLIHFNSRHEEIFAQLLFLII